ncbi:MAG: NAD-dependent epimerase/dehydratase family protein [Syntrophales bacterium LBB04]|nr:NAD-dependent epimerase/dehydratase family protein [Syntrophales bacterium LBB04]
MKDCAESSILVTGGAGFVGANLVRRLLESDVSAVHIVDNLLSAERISVPEDPRIRFTEGSIADDRVLAGVNDDYDYIFHLSTYHGNQSSIHDPIADHANNTITTLKLLERIKNFRRLKKWVYSSAGCAVAEKTLDQACATGEDGPVSLHMDSPYSISKIVGEYYAVYYFSYLKVPTVRARFQNVYGPGEILGAGQWRGTPATVWRNVTPTFVYKALKREALPVQGGEIPSRDFIFVEDIVRGLMLCALNGAPGDMYNLASGVETRIVHLATMINELTGNPTPLQLLPMRDWDHSGKRFGSTVKSRDKLGFHAEEPLREGLMKTVEWTRQNLPLIESCINKHAARMKE